MDGYLEQSIRLNHLLSKTPDKVLPKKWESRINNPDPFVSSTLDTPTPGELWEWETKEEFGFRVVFAKIQQEDPLAQVVICVSPISHYHVISKGKVIEVDKRIRGRCCVWATKPVDIIGVDVVRLAQTNLVDLSKATELVKPGPLFDVVGMYSIGSEEFFLDRFFHLLTTIYLTEFPSYFYLLRGAFSKFIPEFRSRKDYLAETPARLTVERIVPYLDGLRDSIIAAGREFKTGWTDMEFDALGSTLIEFGLICRQIAATRVVGLPGPAPQISEPVCKSIVKRTGKPCQNRPKPGSEYCGVHSKKST